MQQVPVCVAEYLRAYICVCMYVCKSVRLHSRVYVCVCVGVFVRACTRVFECSRHVYVYIEMCLCTCVHVHRNVSRKTDICKCSKRSYLNYMHTCSLVHDQVYV